VRSHLSNRLDCQKHETIQTLTKNAWHIWWSTSNIPNSSKTRRVIWK
jgi:hypothetical protein